MPLILRPPGDLSNLGLRPWQPRGCALVHPDHATVVPEPFDDAVRLELGPLAGEKRVRVKDGHTVLDGLLRPTYGTAMNEEADVHAKSPIDVGRCRGIAIPHRVDGLGEYPPHRLMVRLGTDEAVGGLVAVVNDDRFTLERHGEGVLAHRKGTLPMQPVRQPMDGVRIGIEVHSAHIVQYGVSKYIAHVGRVVAFGQCGLYHGGIVMPYLVVVPHQDFPIGIQLPPAGDGTLRHVAQRVVLRLDCHGHPHKVEQVWNTRTTPSSSSGDGVGITTKKGPRCQECGVVEERRTNGRRRRRCCQGSP